MFGAILSLELARHAEAGWHEGEHRGPCQPKNFLKLRWAEFPRAGTRVFGWPSAPLGSGPPLAVHRRADWAEFLQLGSIFDVHGHVTSGPVYRPLSTLL